MWRFFSMGHCVTCVHGRFMTYSAQLRIVDRHSQLSYLPFLSGTRVGDVWRRCLMTVETCSVPPCGVMLRKDSLVVS